MGVGVCLLCKAAEDSAKARRHAAVTPAHIMVALVKSPGSFGHRLLNKAAGMKAAASETVYKLKKVGAVLQNAARSSCSAALGSRSHPLHFGHVMELESPADHIQRRASNSPNRRPQPPFD